MTNIQIAMDEQRLAAIRSPGQNVTQIMCAALATWRKRRQGGGFEQEWITALAKNPDDTNRAEEWREPQAWTAA